MFLDAAEEKMLRAIVQTAVASAAAGHPFAGEFRHYRISAARLQVDEEGVAQVEARIVAGSALRPKIIASVFWPLASVAWIGRRSSLTSSLARGRRRVCRYEFLHGAGLPEPRW